MVEIKKDNLEEALGRTGNEKQSEIPRDVEIGFHQGALNTLINERNELVRMIQQVESVMQAHMKRLEEMGIKIKTEEK
jgi:hypothetical protein